MYRLAGTQTVIDLDFALDPINAIVTGSLAP